MDVGPLLLLTCINNSCGLATAVMEYSCPSVCRCVLVSVCLSWCVCVCLCVSVYMITQKNNGSHPLET